jgi:hypothetical protein
MCSFWAGGISSFPFSRAREYRLLRRLEKIQLQLNCADLTLKDNQHAFLKGRSTIPPLIEISQKWFDETKNTAHGRRYPCYFH